MKKSRLEIEYTYDFELIGLISSAKGYRLAWEINKLLGVRLVKQPDLVIQAKKKSVLNYAFFASGSNVNQLKLFRNKPNEIDSVRGLLIPEFPHLDFILLAQGDEHMEINRLQELLSNIPSIELVAFIPLAALKSKENFIF
ncbi:MAG: IPExxxVDY family protein [Bacteroidia bacterium]|nr:IPExxxVDY family protein [Bacteroidia bacterium]